MNYLYAAFLGYFLGCINISYIYGRLRGLDIRKTGTTNAGASNALLTFGPVFGITAALCDIGKTVLASCLADAAFRDEYSGSIAAAACILGHIYPVSMGFRGGKGIASFGGYVLSSDWRVFLGLLSLAVILILITDYGILGTNTAVALYPVYLLVIKKPPFFVFLSVFVSLVIIWKHRFAIKRIFRGTETPVSAAWKRSR